MRELTKEEYSDCYRRFIPSLAALLRYFEVEFTVSPEGNDFWRLLRPIPDGVICEVAAYQRDDKQPGYDVGVVYYVSSVNPLALMQNETTIKFMRDLEHGASCGCSGCYSRIQRQWQYFQDRKTAAAETSRTNE